MRRLTRLRPPDQSRPWSASRRARADGASASTRAVVSLLVWLGAAHCDAAGCGSDPVARLLEQHSEVQRDHASSVGRWTVASRGDRFDVGDGLRTGAQATAELRLYPDGRMRVESRTIVRFQDTPPGQRPRRLRVESGAIELESDGVDIEISTSAGLARVVRGSRVKIRGAGERVGFEVLVGRVRMEDGKEFEQGQRFSVDVGRLVIEEAAPAPPVQAARVPSEPVAASPPAPAPAAKVSPGPAADRYDDPPSTAHLALPAGESATVHDPRTPTHVRIDFSNCPEQGVVEVARGSGYDFFRVKGAAGAAVRLPVGNYRYRVRCYSGDRLAKASSARGRIRVLKDAGVRRLPRTAPDVAVDADGRRYTVRYQNRLPRLTLRWPDAPAGPYELELQSPGGRRRKLTLASPNRTFKPGRLVEGEHRFVFRAAGRSSAPGLLSIEFDNASRAAYLSRPKLGSALSGAAVRVSGAALSQSAVSVNGKPLTLKAQGRFSDHVAVPKGLDALSVRVQHGATGVHYYLRHLQP